MNKFLRHTSADFEFCISPYFLSVEGLIGTSHLVTMEEAGEFVKLPC